jgi:hypothetical protein
VWQPLVVHVARSAFGGPWEAWQFVQVAWPLTAWSAGSFGRSWQLVHAGGDAGPFGPCGRWQDAQPPGTAPCFDAASGLWHVLHAPAAGMLAACDAWQLAHAAWPGGAVVTSALWQVPHAGAA